MGLLAGWDQRMWDLGRIQATQPTNDRDRMPGMGQSHNAVPKTGGGAKMRLFAAIEVPPAVARTVHQQAEAAVADAPHARAVDVDLLHVTVAFLGDVEEEVFPVVARMLDTAFADIQGATLVTLGSDVLLAGGRARGLTAEVELLAQVNAARDRFIAGVAPYALEVENGAWLPHLTLIRSRGRSDEHQPLPRVELPHTSWVAPAVGLYASLPGPTQRHHRLMHAAAFGVSTTQGV
jgi:2'-5' RNA ligase